MSLTATLVVSNSPAGPSGGFIQSTPLTGTLTVTNTGTTATVIQTVIPWVTGSGSAPAPVYSQREVVPYSATILPGATLMMPVNYTTPGATAQVQGVGVDAIDSYFTLGATIYSTDPVNPVLSPVPLMITTTSGVPIPVGGQGGAATSSPAQGQIRYDMSFSTPTLFLW
jgi:hypothetical protein